MTDKPYEKIGDTYYPKKNRDNLNDEVKGAYWRAWRNGNKYFYEFDVGHFSTKFKVVEISGDDFLSLKDGRSDNSGISKKYNV